MNKKITSAYITGIEANIVEIEVDMDPYARHNSFNILGFPTQFIKDSRERIFNALKNNDYPMPKCKITLNFYPSILKYPKSYDLPIALTILLSNAKLKLSDRFLRETIVIGELSLDGTIRGVKGILPIAHQAYKLGIRRLVIPAANYKEASFVDNLEIICVSSFYELIRYLEKETKIDPIKYKPEPQIEEYREDFSDVKGHALAKRAFQISAAGRHNIIMVGAPGSGKTMLAQRLKTIMPPMSTNEIIETSKIYSVSNKNNEYNLITQRPYREPHHTTSQIGLVGGGTYIEPGEISLAHNGILFMDEFAEYKRAALEALRQPMESNKISLSRANQHVEYPASFLLVAALNPCPCGYHGDIRHTCNCSYSQIQTYFEKISGPLLDRIDLQLILNPIEFSKLQSTEKTISSAQLKEKVVIANEIQLRRNGGKYNGLLFPAEIDEYCKMTPEAIKLLKIAYDKLKLSSRSYHKIIKVSRTIADLDPSQDIKADHIKEALMYRAIDKRFKEQNAG
jgi:magnesium chelatase family protein